MDIGNPEIFRRIVIGQGSIFQGKDRAVDRQCIDHVAVSLFQGSDVLVFDLRVLQTRQIHILVHEHDTICRSQIDNAVFIFSDITYRSGRKSVFLVEYLPLPFFQDADAAVVRTDPQTFFGVEKETDHACDPCRSRIDTFKCVAVIPDQSAVTADPHKAFRRLYDGICLRRRKTVCIVIEHRGITVGLVDQ